MTTVEQNKSIVSEFIEALFSRGELEAVDRYLAPHFVNHDPPLGVSADREGMRSVGAMMRAAFPDWRSDQHLVVGEGDIVVEHFTATGTHRGDVMGVPPSGERVSLRGINIFRLDAGRIVERWGRLDDLGFLSQLGVVNRPA
jgi:steroid delta-isomerase-like uncharacterized protein